MALVFRTLPWQSTQTGWQRRQTGQKKGIWAIVLLSIDSSLPFSLHDLFVFSRVEKNDKSIVLSGTFTIDPEGQLEG